MLPGGFVPDCRSNFRVDLCEASCHPICVIHNRLLTFLEILESLDLGHAQCLAAALKPCSNKHLHRMLGSGIFLILCAEREDVAIVMLADITILFYRCAQHSADPIDFAGRN